MILLDFVSTRHNSQPRAGTVNVNKHREVPGIFRIEYVLIRNGWRWRRWRARACVHNRVHISATSNELLVELCDAILLIVQVHCCPHRRRRRHCSESVSVGGCTGAAWIFKASNCDSSPHTHATTKRDHRAHVMWISVSFWFALAEQVEIKMRCSRYNWIIKHWSCRFDRHPNCLSFVRFSFYWILTFSSFTSYFIQDKSFPRSTLLAWISNYDLPWWDCVA